MMVSAARMKSSPRRSGRRLASCSSGIGKSGHIGKKLAATFASTGTPAFFVHPAEALHPI
jgi:D-arabinose 5-phosphate isomerase GutQ